MTPVNRLSSAHGTDRQVPGHREIGRGDRDGTLCVSPDLDRPVAVKAHPFRKGLCGHRAACASFSGTSRWCPASQASQHRQGLREGLSGRIRLSGDGVRRWIYLETHTRIDKLLPLHRVIGIIFKCCMALDSAYQGNHSSRHQAGEHPGDRQRRAQAGRFRTGAQPEQEHGPHSTFIMGIRVAILHVAGADQVMR